MATRLPTVGSEIGAWGTTLNDYLRNVGGVTPGDKGAVGDGVADDSTAVQAAVDAVLASGSGTVFLPAGTYKISTALTQLIAANKSLTLQGAGMYQTTLLCGQAFATNGLIGYANGNLAQLTVRDLTIDGNYSGQGGTLPQTASAALVSLTYPFTNAFSPPTPWPGGSRHLFHRVRFYRPCGFTFQGVDGVILRECLFDRCGQPDVAAGGTHYDILGSADGEAYVLNCTYLNSSGNYADFVWASDSTRRIKCVFAFNESFNHQIGGFYACGDGSIMTGNRLRNTNVGSYIGYDASTISSIRGGNWIYNNPLLQNLTVVSGGDVCTEALGDRVFGNNAADQGGAMQTVASTATVTLPAGEEVVKISGTANITSITAGRRGRVVTLIFTGTAAGTGLTVGSNLKIGANFVYTPDDAITLASDGTNWYRPAAGAAN